MSVKPARVALDFISTPLGFFMLGSPDISRVSDMFMIPPTAQTVNPLFCLTPMPKRG
jgi:hypothetical protein